MKIEVGMEVTQVSPIEEYGFNYVGENFIITKSTDAVIVGRGVNVGVGFGIESSEFMEYFKPTVKPIVNETEIVDNIKVIRNGSATVVILPDGSKGVSRCLPVDQYDEEKGYRIAYLKAKMKSYSKELKRLSK